VRIDPPACLEQLADLARRGVRSVRLVFNGNGEWSPRETQAGMELFAREVLPACRSDARFDGPCPGTT
jgi:hypothetical protein